jgi:RNA polymerase sigma-70 factor (ECF subfamily)
MAPNITSEDPDLAAQVRAGDRTAIQTVVETYLAQILRAARGAGLAPERAEDVTQATFTTFIEAAPRFEGRSSVRTWLFGILYKKIAEARRARQRDNQHEEIDEAFERRFDASGKWQSPPEPVDTVLHNKEVEVEIFTCLDAAPLRQALVFILREVEELSTEDICNVLGITRTNLGVMIHRIRNRIRDCLEAKGIRK